MYSLLPYIRNTYFDVFILIKKYNFTVRKNIFINFISYQEIGYNTYFMSFINKY